LEQPILVKCHLCGDAAQYAFAYARFSERDVFLGVIYRGVCGECLREYIEKIKSDRHARGESWFWLVVFLPIGGLLAALADSTAWQIVGFCLILLAILLPLGSRIAQRREARRANTACDEENEAKYSEQMCREDAARTNRQMKLIPLRAQYLEERYSVAKISDETGVSAETAAFLKALTPKALGCIQNTIARRA
jgi:hypothetical protein